ncbi:hypothetical protein [Roseibium sediminicola]|uniref:HdeA/HdeB family protein n=1 Tax=Roseibium sediminicola TaxID=2933272 RepID=A0ABT0GZC9_9HYPH|nr:hypothetical protein [Roseibium sp. CAU 1639]MCK7614795.1 hypothetical protein [Roseibium sp. CAU 1639]
MKKTLLALALTLSFAGPAFAGDCSIESVQQKALDVATELQSFAQKDPARFQEITQEMQTEAAKLQTTGNVQELCDYYDKVLDEIRA